MPRVRRSTGTPACEATVQLVDGRLVHDRVGLDPDPRGPARCVVVDLGADPRDEPVADRLGRDEEPLVLGVPREPGEVVEQVRDVLADLGVRGEEPEVLVLPRRLRVVVAGPDVRVAADALGLVTDDERELAVGLQPDEPVHDMAAGLLQLPRPLDVGLLVEAGLDLDDDQHLLARLRGVDEGVDDRGVAGGPVEGLLDREDVRVRRGLLDEPLHGGRERVVGVVQEHVAAAERGEDVDR